MTQWWICPKDNQVCIDDASIMGIDCSAVPTNMYLVWWYGTNGEILYKHSDRVPMREPFTDIAPFIPLFNAWILAAQSNPPGTSPPITVTQARFTKSALVDALFAAKRQMPVTAYGYQWDASDAATGAMTDEIAALSGTDAINSAVGGLAASADAAVQALAASANAAVESTAVDVNAALHTTTDNLNGAMGTYAGNMSAAAGVMNTDLDNAKNLSNTNIGTSNTNFGSLSNYNVPSGGGALPSMSGLSTFPGAPVLNAPSTSPAAQGTVPGGHTVTAPRIQATPATGPDITWPPLNGPPVTLTYVQFTDLLKQITTRRNSLQQVRTSHKNNIATLGTVTAIAAYDITAGW